MANTAADPGPAPGFPSWPFSCMAFYNHLAEDYGRFAQAMTKAGDPAQAAQAEGDLGVSVMHDMLQAWWELALMPMNAMMKTVAQVPPGQGA